MENRKKIEYFLDLYLFLGAEITREKVLMTMNSRKNWDPERQRKEWETEIENEYKVVKRETMKHFPELYRNEKIDLILN